MSDEMSLRLLLLYIGLVQLTETWLIVPGQSTDSALAWLAVSVATSAIARGLVATALVCRTDGFLGGFFSVTAPKLVELVLQVLHLQLEGFNAVSKVVDVFGRVLRELEVQPLGESAVL